MLTQDRLKEVLHYDPETGVFTRLVSTNNRVKVGAVAGTIHHTGYCRIKIDGKDYLAHRLAFLYMTGEFPKDQADHIDGNPANNRWSNLRECTHAENQQNRASKPGSTSKHVGINRYKKTQKWRAAIKINGKPIHLGYFETEEAAYQAYCKAKAEHHTFQPNPRGLIPC